jgi:hypothetical protein
MQHTGGRRWTRMLLEPEKEDDLYYHKCICMHNRAGDITGAEQSQTLSQQNKLVLQENCIHIVDPPSV